MKRIENIREEKKDRKLKFSKIKKELTEFRYNPTLKIKQLISLIKKFILENKLFCLFILLNVLNGLLLRAFTIRSIDNVFNMSPLLADIAFLGMVGSFGYLMKKRNRVIYWFVLTLALSIICMINSSYYTFYTSFTSISLILTLKYIGAVGDAVVENVFQLKDFIYYFMPIIFYFVAHRLKKTDPYYYDVNKDLKLFNKTMVSSVVVAICFCCTLTSTDIGRLTKQWNREYIVTKYGIYIYHVNDLIKSIQPKVTALFGYDKAVRIFNEYFIEEEKPKTNEYTNRFKGKNIIGIHAESIQNFVIGLEINGIEVTPNLNKLIKESLYFNNFYTQVSVGTSSDTEFTLATSLMPSNTGTAFGSYFDRTYIAMPQLLKDKGYYTFAMHGNNADYWNRRIMHKNLGYDTFYAKDTFEIDEWIGLGLSDVSFFHQSVEKLKVIDEEYDKYYGTFIMLTNHTPFSSVDKYGEFDVSLKEMVKNEETGEKEEVVYQYMEGTKLGNYLKSVHYADYALGLFFDELKENGLLEDTVIVLYGDHDARLPQEDFVRLYNYDKETNGILDDTDPNYVEFNDYHYELNRKVPLIIWSKDNTENAKTIDQLMGMYDLMPTLGNMFGFSNKYALGHDIFNLIGKENVVVFPTGNFLTSKVYYNSQKDEFFVLNNSVVTEDYIAKYKEYSDKLLSVSNAIIVFDLIKKTDENQINEADVMKEAASNG